MRLIGLAGKARTGKSTAATYLAGEYGFAHHSFALPIKRGLSAMLDIPISELEKHKETPLEGLGLSPRTLMQTLGTEWGRDLKDDFWVVMVQRRYQAAPADCPGLVVSDVRFENEAEWIRSEGGEVWHVVRPEADDVARHSSENGVKMGEGDKSLPNTGTIEDLHRRIDLLLDGVSPETAALMEKCAQGGL